MYLRVPTSREAAIRRRESRSEATQRRRIADERWVVASCEGEGEGCEAWESQILVSLFLIIIWAIRVTLCFVYSGVSMMISAVDVSRNLSNGKSTVIDASSYQTFARTGGLVVE